MTGYDQFREGIKAAVESGVFSGDFEVHPIGTARRLRELEECAALTLDRDAADDVSNPAYTKDANV